MKIILSFSYCNRIGQFLCAPQSCRPLRAGCQATMKGSIIHVTEAHSTNNMETKTLTLKKRAQRDATGHVITFCPPYSGADITGNLPQCPSSSDVTTRPVLLRTEEAESAKQLRLFSALGEFWDPWTWRPVLRRFAICVAVMRLCNEHSAPIDLCHFSPSMLYELRFMDCMREI